MPSILCGLSFFGFNLLPADLPNMSGVSSIKSCMSTVTTSAPIRLAAAIVRLSSNRDDPSDGELSRILLCLAGIL